VVTHCGRICLGRKKINFSTVFAGQAVGIKEVHDDIWLVSVMDYDLGYFDLEGWVLDVSLMCPAGPRENGAPGGTRTPDLLVRSQTLYPTELRARCVESTTYGNSGHFFLHTLCMIPRG
jgi:hypothetical protein